MVMRLVASQAPNQVHMYESMHATVRSPLHLRESANDYDSEFAYLVALRRHKIDLVRGDRSIPGSREQSLCIFPC